MRRVICSTASTEYEAIDGTYHEKERIGAMNAAYHQDGAIIKIDNVWHLIDLLLYIILVMVRILQVFLVTV